MERGQYRESEGRYRSSSSPRGGYDDDRYENRGRRESSGGRGYESSGSRRGGYSEDVGQGGWFGDRDGHSEAGRRGGEVRHERAMRAPRDEYGDAEDVGQGGWFGG